MIPKIIHYSWFSGDKYPEAIERYIKLWHEFLPGYEFMLWDMARLDKEIDSDFAKEAISQRKWAFAADYTRLFAINKYGGIWFDTDVELFKNIDDLLDCDCFIGKESWADNDGFVYLTSHFMGAVKGHPFMKECLDYYTDRHFIIGTNSDGKPVMDQTMISQMQSEIALKYGLDRREKSKDKAQILTNGVKIYPSYCFCRPLYTSIKKVYAIHRVAGAWRDKDIDPKSMTDPKRLTLRVVGWRLLHLLGLK